jgi:hypothetical protein
LRAEPGHITPGRRASLVDAVLDLPEVRESARLEAAFRLGDGESLHRLQERCQDVRTRPAGWSALLDASLPSNRASQHVPNSAGQEPLTDDSKLAPLLDPAALRKGLDRRSDRCRSW